MLKNILIKENILKILFVFLLFFIYLNGFLSRYDVGANLDDKIYTMISSQLAFLGNGDRDILFNFFVENKLDQISDIDRYEFRFNTIGNYVLPSFLMRGMYFLLGESEVGLSLSIFLTYSLLFFTSVLFLVYSYCTREKINRSFWICYLILILLGSAQFLHDDPFKISSILFQYNMDYAPMIYAPRGNVALILPLIAMSFIEKRWILFSLSSLLAIGMHSTMAIMPLLALLPVSAWLVIKSRIDWTCFCVLIIMIIIACLLSFSFYNYPSKSVFQLSTNFSAFEWFHNMKLKVLIFGSVMIFLLFKQKNHLIQHFLLFCFSLYFGVIVLKSLVYFGLLGGDKLHVRLEALTVFTLLTPVFWVGIIMIKDFIEARNFKRYLKASFITTSVIFIIFYNQNILRYAFLNIKTAVISASKIYKVGNDYTIYKNRKKSSLDLPIKASVFKKIIYKKYLLEPEVFLLMHKILSTSSIRKSFFEDLK